MTVLPTQATGCWEAVIVQYRESPTMKNGCRINQVTDWHSYSPNCSTKKEAMERVKMAACEFLKLPWMRLGDWVFCIHLAAIFKRHGATKQTFRAIFDIFVPTCSTLQLSAGFLSSCNPFRSYCSKAQRWPLVSKRAAASCTSLNFGVGRRPFTKPQRATRSADWPLIPIYERN